MARGRMINQTIDYDPEFNALSIEAQMLYLRALAFLDRDGLIIGNPRGLLNRVAPLMDHLQPHVPDIINEWVMQGLVIRYAVKIGDILFFKGFGKNQSGMHYDRETPSHFEPPPGWTHGPKGLIQKESGLTPTQPESSVQTESGTTPAEVLQDSGTTPATVGNESVPIEVKLIEDQLKPIEDDDEDTQAREPVAQAWFDYYGEEVPDNLKERLEKLEIECNVDGVIHGIAASARAKTRTFRYIAECARNYIPPPPNDDYANSNGYSVELPAQEVDFMPGVHPMTPPANTQPPPPLPPPMAHDDPWAVALAELSPTLPGVAAAWLKDSRLEPSGELAGVPLYRVMVLTDAANIGWLTQQAEPAIRRKLGSLFGKRILVEIIAATVPSMRLEPTP